ncbi:MAG: 3-methyl-2-oxobutanoate hydroxymethyltransferase [Kiritimatiellae bacterium]|nr:3-methyl-2-oxobutanoate hydroxymethyltransferase [Kiritimatiellia bacterium]
MKTWNVNSIKALKGQGKISCLTAYDYTTARIIDQAEIQLILVGDSLGMTMLGYKTTLPVTLEHMLHHAEAVARGVVDAMVVVDMPFMSYQISIEDAISNAGMLMKNAGVDAVKIEGGAFRVPVIEALVENGIPVMGHIGLTPQSVHAMGGYKVQGKKSEDAIKLVEDAKALADAGAFAVVLECIPALLGEEISKAIDVPTIGIGAGAGCDGQILVTHDMLGLYSELTPKFVKRYANMEADMKTAFKQYKDEVEDSEFPADEHTF